MHGLIDGLDAFDRDGAIGMIDFDALIRRHSALPANTVDKFDGVRDCIGM